MIGTASKVGGWAGFYLAMNSESLNTMVLWNSLCIGVGALAATVNKSKKMRLDIGIIMVCFMVAGSFPFALAGTGVDRVELPESGDIYDFYRGGKGYERHIDTVNTSLRTQQLNNCGVDTCQVTGKTEIIMSLFAGSSFNVDLAQTDMTISKSVKILVHDYSFNQPLAYDYSQYDYGIGILEGDSNQNTAELPKTDWYKEEKFLDNVDSYIEMFGVISDKRRLPNNLRSFHYSGSQESIDCGSWSATGDHYSRQVVVPKERGISFFTADQGVTSSGLFEVIYEGKSIFKTFEEMREGFEIDKGLEISIADFDKPNPRNLKMFCHHAPGDRFENCHEYNYPGLGNPSSEGPGHYQVSKMLRKDQDITTSNHFFGRNDWTQQMTWYRMEGCDDGAPAGKMGDEEFDSVSKMIGENDFEGLVRTQGLKIEKIVKGLRGTSVIDLSGFKNREIFVSNDMISKPPRGRSDGLTTNEAIFSLFDITDLDEKKKIIEAYSKSGRFGLFAWIMLAILAALIVAAITVTVIWQDLKDNCCGLNRYGYNNFDKINTYAVSLNNSWSAYKPLVKQSGKVISGEPVDMSIEYRNSQETRARIMLSMDGYSVALNNEQIYVMSFTVVECNAFKSGSTGSCVMNYEVVGTGGNVKLTAEGCKLNNVMVSMKAGINSDSFGINSVSFITSEVKFCVAGTTMCSTVGVQFTSSPDGSGDLLENGNPIGGLYMTFDEMFKGNSLFAFTFVLTCFVTAIFLILMLVAMGTLIKDYIRPNIRGVDLKRITKAVVILGLISGGSAYEIYASKASNCKDMEKTGLICSFVPCARYDAFNDYQMAIVLNNIDFGFINASNCDNEYFQTTWRSKTYKLGTCTQPASNVSLPNLDVGVPTSSYHLFSPKSRKDQPGVMNMNYGIVPYTGKRATEMLLIGTLQAYYYHVLTDQWYKTRYRGKADKIAKPTLYSGCMETHWEPYWAVCNKTEYSPEGNFCFGCYGSSICGWSRGDDVYKRKNLLCAGGTSGLPDNIANTQFNVTLTDIGVWGTGLFHLKDNKFIQKECAGGYGPEYVNWCNKAIGLLSGKGGFSSGFEIKHIEVLSDGINDIGFTVEVLGQVSFNVENILPGNLCPVVSDLESTPGPAKCVAKGYMVHCIIYCELKEPTRPDSEIGKAKMSINAAGKSGSTALEKTKGSVRKIVKELLSKSRKTAKLSLMEPTNRNARSSINYDNIFLTKDGVALGIQEGGPHKLFCYFGDYESAFCNSTMGFGWVKSIPLKPVYNGDGSVMNIPNGEVYVTFSLGGISCTGGLTDETGELVCDSDCCITSFDNFETFVYLLKDIPVKASSKTAMSFKVNTNAKSAKVTGKVYPQGINSEYNGTCARGATVPMLWSCTYIFYPDIFWGVNGTTIAAAVLGLAFAIWHMGVKGIFRYSKEKIKKAGKFIYQTGVEIARGIREVGGTINIHSKLRMGEILIESIDELLECDGLLGNENEVLETLKSKLEPKLEKWKKEKKVKKDKNRPFGKKRNPDAVTFYELNQMRIKVKKIADRLNKEETKTLLKTGGDLYEEMKVEVEEEKRSKVAERASGQKGKKMK